MRKALVVFAIISGFIFSGTAFAQFFTPVVGGGEHQIIVEGATIDGNALAFNDEIGVFDGDLCVGSGVYMGFFPVMFTASAQVGENPGYIDGNPMIFKIGSAVHGIVEADVRATFTVGEGVFGEGATWPTLYAYTQPQPQISLSHENHNFGNVTVGYDSDPFVFTITNDGDAILNVSEITVGDGFSTDFDDQNPFAINPEGSELVTVTFHPTLVQAYEDIAVNIQSNDPVANQTQIIVQGNGIAAVPNIVVDDVIVNTTLGTPNTINVDINNDGTSNLVITEITIVDTDNYTVEDFGEEVTVAPEGTEQIQLTYDPLTLGNHNTTMTFVSNDPDGNKVINVSGTATAAPAPAIVVPTDNHDFGEVSLTQSNTWQMAIQNNGNANLVITSIVSNNPNVFTIENAVFDIIIAPEGTENVTVRFSPELRGAANATLTINSNDNNNPNYDVSVSGTGIDYYTPSGENGEIPYPIFVLSASLDNIDLQVGDEIGIFDEGLCVGSILLTNDNINNDQYTTNVYPETVPGNNDGYVNGNSIVFNLFDYSSSTEYSDVRAIFEVSDGTFGNAGLASADLYGFSTNQPEIQLASESHDFGEVQVDNNSDPWTLNIQNTGDAVLSISSVEMHNGYEEFSANFTNDFIAPLNIAAGQTGSIDITFQPSLPQEYTDILVDISSNDQVLSVVTVALSGTGTEPLPDISVAFPIPFGTTQVGVPVNRNVEISNTGDADLLVTAVSIVDDINFSVENIGLGFSVAQGATETVVVTYDPQSEGTHNSTLVVASDDFDEPEVNIEISGTATAAPEASIFLAENSHDFGEVRMSQSATWNMAVQNTGNANLVISNIDSDNADFVAEVDGYDVIIVPEQTLNIPVRYTPSSRGIANAQFTIISNAGNDPDYTVDLTGTGIDYYSPVAGVGDYAVLIPQVMIDDVPLDIGDEIAVFDGEICVGMAVIVDENTPSISVVRGTEENLYNDGYRPGNPISYRILDVSNEIEVINPRAVYDDGFGDGLFGTLPYSAVNLYGYTTDQPEISISTPSHDFGDEQVGNTTAEWGLTIENTGDATLSIQNLSIGGDYTAVFTWDFVAPLNINAGLTGTINFAFTPQAEVDYTDIPVIITSNDPVFSTVTLSLSGTGTVPRPAIDLSLSSEFGSTTIGNPITRDLQIANNGTATLTVTEISIDDNDHFSVLGFEPPLNVEIGQTETVQIQFNPSIADVYSTTCHVTSNDLNSPTDIALVATGTVAPEPSIFLANNSHDFGDVRVSESDGWTMTVQNQGTANLEISSITVDDEQFSVVEELQALEIVNPEEPIIVEPEGSFNFLVTFTPNSRGLVESALHINSNDPDTPAYDVSISGTGTDFYSPVPSTGLDYGIIIIGVLIDDIPLVEGDEVGVFDGELCVANGIVANDNTVILTAVEGTEEFNYTNGFRPGNPISYRILDVDASVEITNPRAEYEDGNGDGLFGTLPFSAATLYGFTVSQPIISLQTNSHDFGNVTVGETSEAWNLVVQNDGDADLEISAVTVDGDFQEIFSTLVELPLIIPTTQNNNIPFTFSPTEEIEYTDIAVEIVSNDPVNPNSEILLSGTGSIPRPSISVPQNIDFGTVIVGESVNRNLVVTNNGDADLIVTSLEFSNNLVFHLPLEQVEVEEIVTPGNTATYSIIFTPLQAVDYEETVTVSSNDQEGPVLVNLLGTGSAASVILPVDNNDFGEVKVATSDTWEMTIANRGVDVRQVVSIESNIPEFTLENIPETIPGNGEATVTVRFSPLDRIDYNGTITVTTDDPVENVAEATVSGSGTNFFEVVPNIGDSWAIIVQSATFNGASLLPGDEIGVFDGETCVGMEVVSGDWPMPISTYRAGQGLGGFTDGNPIIYKLLDVSNPPGLEADAVYDSDADTFGELPFAAVQLSVYSIQNIELNLDELVFGNVGLQIESSIDLEISNMGVVDLLVTSATITGDEVFSVPEFLNQTITPEQTVILSVSFTPVEQIAYSGTLVIISDDPNDPRLELDISGTGIAATPPELAITNPLSDQVYDINTSYNIEWTLNSTSTIQSVLLEYVLDGDNPDWTFMAELPGEGTDGPTSYEWTTPDDIFTDYAVIKITATNEAELNDVETVDVNIGPHSLSKDFNFAWYMVSIPLITERNDINSVFDDLTGPFFLYDFSSIAGYSRVDMIEHGAGYWLAVSNNSTETLQGVPEFNQSEFQLSTDWNLIGSAFPVSIPLEDLMFTDGIEELSYAEAAADENLWISPHIFYYVSETGSYDFAASLDPWNGYWIQVLQDGITMISIPPRPTVIRPLMLSENSANGQPSISQANKNSFTISADVNREINTRTLSYEEIQDWYIPVNITTADSDIATVGFGVHGMAKDGFDNWYDVPVPPKPVNNEYLTTYFKHEDWQEIPANKFIQDVRSNLEEYDFESWILTIESSQQGVMSVEFEDILDNLTEGYYAFATIGNETYNLLDNNVIQFYYDDVTDIRIKITTYMNQVNDELTGIPEEFSIAAVYPNPFNPSVNLVIGIPETTELKAKVYDLLGREVASLDYGQIQPGYQKITWTAEVSSGMYLVQVNTSKGWNSVEKVILMK